MSNTRMCLQDLADGKVYFYDTDVNCDADARKASEQVQSLSTMIGACAIIDHEAQKLRGLLSDEILAAIADATKSIRAGTREVLTEARPEDLGPPPLEPRDDA